MPESCAILTGPAGAIFPKEGLWRLGSHRHFAWVKIGQGFPQGGTSACGDAGNSADAVVQAASSRKAVRRPEALIELISRCPLPSRIGVRQADRLGSMFRLCQASGRTLADSVSGQLVGMNIRRLDQISDQPLTVLTHMLCAKASFSARMRASAVAALVVASNVSEIALAIGATARQGQGAGLGRGRCARGLRNTGSLSCSGCPECCIPSDRRRQAFVPRGERRFFLVIVKS